MTIKDSGKRHEFKTGSVRDVQTGKGRYDLLPTFAMREVAIHFENGAKKYGERNWEKGQELSRYLSSALRHTFQVLAGETDENHARAAAWNLLCFLDTRARIECGLLPSELDDLPKPAVLPNTDNSVSSGKMCGCEALAQREARFAGQNAHSGQAVLVGDTLGVPSNVP